VVVDTWLVFDPVLSLPTANRGAEERSEEEAGCVGREEDAAVDGDDEAASAIGRIDARLKAGGGRRGGQAGREGEPPDAGV